MLETVLDSLAQELDDADILEPGLVGLGLASSVAILRGRGRRLGLDGGGRVRLLRGTAGAAGTLEHAAREASLAVGERRAEADGRGAVRRGGRQRRVGDRRGGVVARTRGHAGRG